MAELEQSKDLISRYCIVFCNGLVMTGMSMLVDLFILVMQYSLCYRHSFFHRFHLFSPICAFAYNSVLLLTRTPSELGQRFC